MTLRVHLEAASDFADLFEVKDKLAKKGELYRKIDNGHLLLGYRRDGFRRETIISSSVPAEVREDGLTFEVYLEPQSSWSTSLDVAAACVRATSTRRPTAIRATKTRPSSVATSRSGSTRRRGWWRRGNRCNIYRRSLVDLAALRFPTGVTPGALPAAGLPWFMAIFGRDSLITSFQALPFAPELAATTLRTLARSRHARIRSATQSRARSCTSYGSAS